MPGISKPPSPRETLAECVWLPRILWKARLSQQGQLPEAFKPSYCAAAGVDGQFLKFFKLCRYDIEAVAAHPNPVAAERFLTLPTISPTRISDWNKLALNLGRPGYPMTDRLELAKQTAYKHVATPQMHTVFEILEADDATL